MKTYISSIQIKQENWFVSCLECYCEHGKCLDGIDGNGRCICYKGWKGVNCSVGQCCKLLFFTIFQINIKWLKCLQCSSFNPEVSPVKWRNLIFSEIVNDECGGICDPNAKWVNKISTQNSNPLSVQLNSYLYVVQMKTAFLSVQLFFQLFFSEFRSKTDMCLCGRLPWKRHLLSRSCLRETKYVSFTIMHIQQPL